MVDFRNQSKTTKPDDNTEIRTREALAKDWRVSRHGIPERAASR